MSSTGVDGREVTSGKKDKEKHSTWPTVGVISAVGRTSIYRLTSFYLRTPVKLFKPPRFDIYHYIKLLLLGEASDISHKLKQPSKFYQKSSLYILSQALSKYGWTIIPNRVLPPLFANSITGIVLYSTYISVLRSRQEDKQAAVYKEYFKAGFVAGVAQSVVSTPIDSIYARSTTDEIIQSFNKYNNLWVYGWHKLKEIGLVGCFGGFNLTLLKESIGFGLYFSIFEIIKDEIKRRRDKRNKTLWIDRFNVFIAGITAAFALQVYQFPFSKLQRLHYQRLEVLDIINSKQFAKKYRHQNKIHLYYHSYVNTLRHIRSLHRSRGDLMRWLYKGFTRNTIAIIPSTTAGLMVLDYMRRTLEPKTPLA